MPRDNYLLTLDTTDKYHRFYLEDNKVGPEFKHGEGTSRECLEVIQEIVNRLDLPIEIREWNDGED